MPQDSIAPRDRTAMKKRGKHVRRGDKMFLAEGARLWLQLLEEMRSSQNPQEIRARCKIFQFTGSFPPSLNGRINKHRLGRAGVRGELGGLLWADRLALPPCGARGREATSTRTRTTSTTTTTSITSSSKTKLHRAAPRPSPWPAGCRPGASLHSPLEGAPRPPFGGAPVPPNGPGGRRSRPAPLRSSAAPPLYALGAGGSISRQHLPLSCLSAGRVKLPFMTS